MTSNFALQVDIKGSSSDSEDVSEVTQRPFHRLKPSTNDDVYEHHSELVISTGSSSRNRPYHVNNDQHSRSTMKTSTNQIEQEILQLRRERAHILDLLSFNWNRSNIWVELTEAKLNYIIGETGRIPIELLIQSMVIDY
jgi:hypothetical protein